MLHPKGTSNASQRGATSAWRTHYAKSPPGNARTNTHCMEKLSVSPSRMIGLWRGLVECGMRNTLWSLVWSSFSVASSLMSATTICQFAAIFVCSTRTRSPFSTHFLSMESPYWDLCFDIFLCEYRHPTCDGTDEGDIAYSYTICLEWWRYLYLVAWVSIDPSLRHELFEHDRYGARGSVPECTLECPYGELLTLSDELSDLLEDDLFLGGELFHNSSGVRR